MKNTQSKAGENLPLAQAIQEVMLAILNLAKSEIKLARAEIKSALRETVKDALFVVIASLISILGLLPFIAFLVIGLGKILNDNYWLSCLIVSLVFMIIGGTIAFHLFKKLFEKDLEPSLMMSHTKQSFRTEIDRAQDRLQELTQKEDWRNAS